MRNNSRWVLVIGGAIAGGIIALVIASTTHTTRTVTSTVVQTASGTSQPTSFATSGGNAMSINQIYKQDAPGVVDILVKSKGGPSVFGGSSGVEAGEGAGVVYNSQGYILTDEHVIDGAIDVVVTFQDGLKVHAKVIGSDAAGDVGVIKVNVPSSELHPIKFADSDSAQVGDPVVAIGSPFSLPETVTSGIVSQTQRVIDAPNKFAIPDAIQTDAPINPGNSGGPLLNAQGQVIGLNDQIDTGETNAETGQGQNAGIGFATPSNEDVKMANSIIAHKPPQQAYLGIEATGADEQTESFTTHSHGVQVGSVTKSGPAAAAGIQPGDVIEKLDSTTITSFFQLVSTLADYDVGQKVTLTIDRSGQTKHVQLTLGNRPALKATTR